MGTRPRPPEFEPWFRPRPGGAPVPVRYVPGPRVEWLVRRVVLPTLAGVVVALPVCCVAGVVFHDAAWPIFLMMGVFGVFAAVALPVLVATYLFLGGVIAVETYHRLRARFGPAPPSPRKPAAAPPDDGPAPREPALWDPWLDGV